MSAFSTGPGTVPMKSRVVHKFYEPLVLLNALNLATRETSQPAITDASIDIRDDVQLFKAFVYKLGHICDSVKGNGGSTITSFCVLKDDLNEDGVHYWFASNQRTDGELEATRTYLVNILCKVNEVSTERKGLAQKLGFRDILSDVLDFNRERLIHYVCQLGRLIPICTEFCPDQSVADELRHLQDSGDIEAVDSSTDFLICHCTRLIFELEKLSNSSAGHVIVDKAKEGRGSRIPSKECWSNLQHMISRILAYPQSVRFILRAKDSWPQLFRSFSVSFLRSSQKMARPLRNKSSTAVGIVGRMTSKAKEIQIFRNFVLELQRFDLDAAVRKEYENPNFRPIVHSEVLLLNWLDIRGLLEPRLFFNDVMYIGCSKPPCKLCHHYFTEHGKTVEQRPTHGNLYLHWRFPDLLEEQGQAGDDSRNTLVCSVLKRIRSEAFDVIRKKCPSNYKEEDSLTFSAVCPADRSTDRDPDDGIGNLSSTLERLNLPRLSQ